MKLNVFNGGRNIRLQGQYIPQGMGVQYNNIDNQKGHFISEYGIFDVSDTVPSSSLPILDFGYWFNERAEAYFTAAFTDYVVFKENLYKTDRIGVPQKRISDQVFANLGIVAPSVKPTVATDGAGTGDFYTYVFTYYNSVDGTESMPSPVSSSIEMGATGIDISVLSVSSDNQVDDKRIYRVGGDLTVFTLVATVTNVTTTYDDDEQDDSALPGTILQSQNYGQAPAGLKFLTLAYAMLFGILGDKLYFTPIGKPNAWPVNNFLDLPNNGTGIAITPIGLLVFTLIETILVTGTGPSSLSQQSLTKDQGCLAHESIVNLNGTAIWVSYDGFCSSRGGPPKIISKESSGKLDFSSFSFNIKNAIVYNENYYLLMSNEQIHMWDFAFGNIYKTRRYEGISLASLHVADNELYGFGDSKVVQLTNTKSLGATALTAQFKSGWLTSGNLVLPKVHDEFTVAYTGVITLTISIDGIEAGVYELSATKFTVEKHKLPIEFTRGYYIEIDIVGRGELFEIEFIENSANA